MQRVSQISKKASSMRLLTVDWDYFFTNPLENDERGNPLIWFYDWGHRESPMFVDGFMWDIRREAFQKQGIPLPGTSGEDVGFWDHIRLMPDADLWVTDSHALAGSLEVLDGIHAIWSFDAHHDYGYGGPDPGPNDFFDCGNWLKASHNIGVKRVHVRYPRWKTKAVEMDHPPEGLDAKIFDPSERLPRFDRVHICRSGAWTPPWLDRQFLQFVKASGLVVNTVASQDVADPLIMRRGVQL